jgi:cytochrome c-type biogenesis protein CcmF
MAIGGILSVTDCRYRLKITKTSPVRVKNTEVERLQEEIPVTTASAASNTVLATETRKA